MFDILRSTLKVALVDRLLGRKDNTVASRERLALLALISYCELVVCFAVVYASDLPMLRGAAGVLDALYFSVWTQLTISFGRPLPDGWLRPVAAAQGLLGLLFIAVIVARMIGTQRNLIALDDDPKAA